MIASLGNRWIATTALAMIFCFMVPRGFVVAAEDSGREQLSQQQTQLAERYRKIEELFMRLADVEATENPERAALLRRAAKKSRDSFILERLSTAAGDLSSEKYQQALTSQKAAQEELESLLKLLMSEDRPKRIREEKERISNWIKDLKRMERSERATRARTENGAELDELEEEQKSIEKRAEEVEQQLREDNEDPIVTEEAGDPSESEKSSDGSESEESEGAESKEGAEEEADSKKSDAKGSEAEGKESEDSEAKDSESKGEQSESKDSEQAGDESQSDQSKESDSKEGESKPSESKPGESQPAESPPSESEPSESQSGESQSGGEQSEQQDPPKTPKEAAQRAVEQARKNMQKAIEKLEESKRTEAVEEQRKAEEELRDAIEKLEQILRRLREEEMLRELARLEARLRQMAQMQTEVLEKTKQLAETPAEQRDRQTDIRAGNLAFDEKKIVLEADRAILLLREEGSSVAFPVVVDQMRNDMQSVADRLTQTKIDAITQGIQEDILAALEEMIGALQQAQRDLEKQQQQQQQQQQQGGQQGEPPLVQPLAELKLLRTMQTRIKSTTERYGSMLPEDALTPSDPDLFNLIKSLSSRQIKLYQISRDLLLKRNQ